MKLEKILLKIKMSTFFAAEGEEQPGLIEFPWISKRTPLHREYKTFMFRKHDYRGDSNCINCGAYGPDEDHIPCDFKYQ